MNDKKMVKFVHPATGEVRMVKLGVSWTLGLFWWIFGIPFFMRKMKNYGIGVIIYVIASRIILTVIELYADVDVFKLWGFAELGISATFFIEGNRITAKYYIKNGFKIDEKEEYKKNAIQKKWLVQDEIFLKPENQGGNQ